MNSSDLASVVRCLLAFCSRKTGIFLTVNPTWNFELRGQTFIFTEISRYIQIYQMPVNKDFANRLPTSSNLNLNSNRWRKSNIFFRKVPSTTGWTVTDRKRTECEVTQVHSKPNEPHPSRSMMILSLPIRGFVKLNDNNPYYEWKSRKYSTKTYNWSLS